MFGFLPEWDWFSGFMMAEPMLMIGGNNAQLKLLRNSCYIMVSSDTNSAELLNCVILFFFFLVVAYNNLFNINIWIVVKVMTRVKVSPKYLNFVHGIVGAANFVLNTISNPLYPNSFYIWLLIRFKHTFWLSLLL